MPECRSCGSHNLKELGFGYQHSGTLQETSTAARDSGARRLCINGVLGRIKCERLCENLFGSFSDEVSCCAQCSA